MKSIFDFENVELPQELPDFYVGDNLHKAKNEKLQENIEKYGLE